MNLQPQTCGLIYKFHEEMHGHLKMLAAFRAGVLNLFSPIPRFIVGQLSISHHSIGL